MKTELSRDLEKTSLRSELPENGLDWLRRLAATTDHISAGKADLVRGRVPASQLPSYVDDVLEYASVSTFPQPGEAGKIYVDLATGRTYRWSGSQYTAVSDPEIRYALASKPVSSGAVALDDRSCNWTATDAAAVSVSFPAAVDGRSRDFVWVLNATGQSAPVVTWTTPAVLLLGPNVSLVPESGTNVYSFTEVASGKFVTSRMKLTAVQTAPEEVPTTPAQLAAAMITLGYTVVQTESGSAMADALGLEASSTFNDCVDKIMGN